MPNALVTGTSGYLGSKIAEHLRKRGWTVLESKGRRNFARSLDSIFSSSTIDLVVHAGFRVDFRLSDQEDFPSKNFENTKLLIEKMELSQAKHFIFLSAAAVLGVSDEFEVVRNEEDIGTSGRSFDFWQHSRYVKEKINCEKLLHGKNFKATILYLTTTYGPGMQPGVKNFFFKMRGFWRRFFLSPPGGTSYLDIRDFLEALDLIIQREVTGKFVLSSGNTTYKQLFRANAKIDRAQRKIWVCNIPKFGFSILRMAMITTGYLKPNAILLSSFGHKYYSPLKFMRTTGWKPKATLEDTLKSI